MKFVLILLLFLSKVTLAGDTLKFGNKSYPLHKVPTYFNTDDYDAHVSIPSEYAKFDKKTEIKGLKKGHKEGDVTQIGEDGTILTLTGVFDTINDQNNLYKITLNKFTDTIYIDKSDIKLFRPNIKTKNYNLFFHDLHFVAIKDSIMRNYTLRNFTYQSLFESIVPNYELSGYSFVIDELYYRKKDAVYKLNYQFIIIIK